MGLVIALLGALDSTIGGQPQVSQCAPLAPPGADPLNYSWRDNRCEGLTALVDKPREFEPQSLMLAGQPRPKARYTLTWPISATPGDVTIRITSRLVPRAYLPSASPTQRLIYRLDAVSATGRLEWPTVIMRTIGVLQSNDITERALATTAETIGGQARLVYLPLDLAQERRFGFGRYSLYFTLASFPTEEITFTATRLSANGQPAGAALPIVNDLLKKDAGRLADAFLRIDLSKEESGLYRIQLHALASADKRPVTAEFLMRHGSTESRS